MKTILAKALIPLAVAVTVFVVFASGYLWYRAPEKPWPYLLAILVVCSAWTLRQVLRFDGEGNQTSLASRQKLTQAIISSGLLLAVALAGVLIARMGWTIGFAS